MGPKRRRALRQSCFYLICRPVIPRINRVDNAAYTVSSHGHLTCRRNGEFGTAHSKLQISCCGLGSFHSTAVSWLSLISVHKHCGGQRTTLALCFVSSRYQNTSLQRQLSTRPVILCAIHNIHYSRCTASTKAGWPCRRNVPSLLPR